MCIDLFHVLRSYSGYYGNCYVGRQRKFVMPTTCAVFGCHNRQTKKIKRSFYRIPRDSDRRRRWLAFIGRRNEDGSPWEPGTGDRVCSDHFLSKKKSDLSTNPDYIPSVRSAQDVPCVNEGAVARFERLERRHSTQQANEKEKKLQTDELHRNVQIVNHDHTYCSNKSNSPTQPALVVTETERQHDDTKKVYSTGIPCEVGKLVNKLRYVCMYKLHVHCRMSDGL